MAGPCVFRDFDQAELDRQYNSRGTVADPLAYIADYAVRTRAAQAALSPVLDVVYGPDPDERIDIYRPAGTAGGPLPVMVFFHGGNWQSLDKEHGGFAAPAFTARGMLFVAAGFSLVPKTDIEGMGRQARRLIAWLYANVARFGGDPACLHVAGHSSGANLVGQLLYANWAALGVPPSAVCSATFISGLADLEPVRLSFRNATLKLTPESARRVSVRHQLPTLDCPLLVAVGEREMPDYKRQAADTAAWWREHGRPAELIESPGRNHFDVVLEWGDAEGALHAAGAALAASASRR